MAAVDPKAADGPTAAVHSRDLPTVAADAALAQAALLLKQMFGLQGALHPLAGEKDANFRVETQQGIFLLKLFHAQAPRAEIELQLAGLLHLAKTAPELPVPRIVPSKTGEPLSSWTPQWPADPARQALLMSFLPGVPLSDVPASPAVLQQLGRRLAQLDQALAGLQHPAAGRKLAWDIARLVDLKPIAQQLQGVQDQGLLLAGMAHYEQQVLPRLSALPQQLIHNDFNPYNLLVDAHDHGRLTGIIDFGDMVRSHRLNDLAIAASYHLDGTPAPLGAATAIIRAYHRESALTDIEQELLAELILARLLATICITESRARAHPENARYILRNNPSAWRGLRRLTALSRDALRASVHEICKEAER